MSGNNPSEPYLANSSYGSRRRELLKLARSLKDLGADSLLDVPKIVVIGSQSAGKSSLVEAVTGINVPRDDGTCTRCPMECTILTTDGPWSCTISLREDAVSKAFGPEITSKDDVEVWIRRAQAAVLCPHLPHDIFKDKTREDIQRLTDPIIDAKVLPFTRNRVVIDIKDPHGADLAFVDLPGLIQNDKDDVVRLVKELVEESIRPRSTIILVAIPANDDMENQQAMKLAKIADPKGERTIGVVTKPDTVAKGQSGAHKKWQTIFEGKLEKHRLRLGYYCVRLPLDDERHSGITPEELKKIATQYFAVTSPWKDLEVPDRLGIDNLVHDISLLLMSLLLEALPKLRIEAQALLLNCLRDLAQLPELHTTDPTAEVVRRVGEFSTHMQDVAYGRSEDKSFVHQSREVYRNFLFDIRNTAPDFRPFEDVNKYIKPSEPSFQQSEDDFLGYSQPSSAKFKSKKKNRHVNLNDSFEASEIAMPASKPKDLENVRSVIKDATGWELPHNIPYEAKVRLIKESVSRWPPPSKTCFRGIRSILDQSVSQGVSDHFGQFPALERHITQLVSEYIDSWCTQATTAVDAVLRREQTPYWTQNEYYLEKARNKWLAHYKSLRRRCDTYRAPSATSNGGGRVALESPQPMMPRDFDAPKLLSPFSTQTTYERPPSPKADEYEEELIVMADVRSYFQVACKRIIDNVPEAIRRDFVEGFANGLQTHLLGQLKIGTPDAAERLKELLAEDPEIAQKRTRIQERRKQLEEIKAQLEGFKL